MKIWIIDHYSVPVKYYPLARNTNFAKYLMEQGHEVIIFAASTVHNSEMNLIEDNKKQIEVIEDGVKYVLVKCHSYTGNGMKRMRNMYEFAGKLESVCKCYEKPDVIMSTLLTPFACKKGIQIGQKYGCRNIAQINDLWPETLIAYGRAAKKHPIVLWLRRIEKWIYRNADRIVFSMEGAYDYIKEQGWEKEVPRGKVDFINNGIDLEQFDFNKEHYQVEDDDIKDDSKFKVIYAGSIRKVNNLGKLLDVAKQVKNERVQFLIWGDGDELSRLETRKKEEQIDNVFFKGRVDKKYIPYITSHADLNFAHNTSSPLFRFGISFNKIFDYFAAGRPIFCDFACKYNPVITEGAGISVSSGNEAEIAEAIDKMAEAGDLDKYSRRAREAAEKYDFKRLTQKLADIMESAQQLEK